jgi:tetracycline repressor-like protein
VAPAASTITPATSSAETIDEQFVNPLAWWLGGERASERAGLIVATLFGLAFMRAVVRSAPLATGVVEDLVALVAPVLQSYVGGKPSQPNPP